MLQMIENTLQKMIESNEKNPCDLEGGAFCASFESPNGGPWIQAKVGALNLH